MITVTNLIKVYGPGEARVAGEVARLQTGKEELARKHRENILALNQVSLTFKKGQISVVMGLSGCGKSTLLRCLNRLVEPSCGGITLDSEDIMALDRKGLRNLRRFRMSMVFQEFSLFPHQSVLENVAFGLKMQKRPAGECRTRALEWIEMAGLGAYVNHRPDQLSGGMKQRAGLARALAADSPVILMDEPFSALDPLTRDDMQTQLLKIQEEFNKTIVFITHDLDEAIRLGSEIAVLKDGCLIQADKPETILRKPADDYVKNFVKLSAKKTTFTES